MTSHYVDIIVVPGPELSGSHLFGALYDRLHLTLVQRRLDSVGVSFPDYRLKPRTLGTTLRLHGDESVLLQLSQPDWLKGVRDYVKIGHITPVPPDTKHRTVQRRQFKTNVGRMRRRRMQRKSETSEQATDAIPASVKRNPDLPYAHLRSRSTRQSFSLFIALGPLVANPIHGHFNSHGLSGTTTVPWF